MIAAVPNLPPVPAPSPAGYPSRLASSRRPGCTAAFRLALACLPFWITAAQAQDLPAPAATAPASPAPAAPASPPPAQGQPIPDGAVLRLLGRDVTGPRGEVVAQLVNLLVDAAGQPRAAILDYGGFLGVGKRRIAVAWTALRFTPGKEAGGIALLLHRDQLTNFPEYKPDAPVTAAALPEGGPSPPAAAPPAATKE